MEIPKPVLQISEILRQNKFQAFLVGGCVRDLLIKRIPKDWDVATNAKPEEIQALFPESVYENQFGTVGVKTDSEDLALKIVEVTTFRVESEYTDKRHPEKIAFAKTIEEDLSRRDFTMNAMAIDLHKEKKLIDPFEGEKDLKAKTIKAVGDPKERFNEDALRLLRAVRFLSQLNFLLEQKTEVEMKNQAQLLEHISKERIRDEFTKLIMGSAPGEAIRELHRLNLLQYIAPELEEGIGVEQNEHHIYSVFDHCVKSLEYAAEKGYSLEIRLAALFHDIGKPISRRWKDKPAGKRTKEGKPGDFTFYGHQVVGERTSNKILKRLKFSNEVIEKVALLVREHMFVYDPEVVTLAGVRRLLSRVGKENTDDLMKLREADRIGSGVPKAQPYRLRYLQAMIEKVKADPISAKMLKVNGDDIINELGITPGPKLGMIIDILLEEVLLEPENNTEKFLYKKARELDKQTEKQLSSLVEKAKKKAEQVQEKIDQEIKDKYFVK